jgi:glycosyltransferase 2 family protein
VGRDLKTWMRILLLAVGIAFLLGIALHSSQTIGAYLATTNLWILALSIVIGAAGYVVSGSVFHHYLTKFGEPSTSAQGRRILLLSQLVKYVPGKIWSLVYQSAALRGIHSAEAVIFANVDLLLLSLVMVGGISFALVSWPVHPWLALPVLGATLVVFIRLTNVCLLHSLAGKFRRLSRRLSGAPGACHWQGGLRPPLFWFFLHGACYTVAHMLFLHTVFGMSVQEASLYTAYLGFAWIAGVMSMVVPGGLGVKEFVFIMLAQMFGATADFETLLAIAVISRLWVIGQELVCVAWVPIESLHLAFFDRSGK